MATQVVKYVRKSIIIISILSSTMLVKIKPEAVSFFCHELFSLVLGLNLLRLCFITSFSVSSADVDKCFFISDHKISIDNYNLPDEVVLP